MPRIAQILLVWASKELPVSTWLCVDSVKIDICNSNFYGAQ